MELKIFSSATLALYDRPNCMLAYATLPVMNWRLFFAATEPLGRIKEPLGRRSEPRGFCTTEPVALPSSSDSTMVDKASFAFLRFIESVACFSDKSSS